MTYEPESLREELRELSPEFPVSSGPEIPEGYFDRLPEQVLARYRADRHRSSMAQRRKLMFAIAAMLAAVAILWWGITPSGQPEPLAGITSEDAYSYVLNHLSEFDHLIPEEVEWTGDDVPWTDPAVDGLSEDELLDELMMDDLPIEF